MIEITSPSNPRYKTIQSLSRKKDRLKRREFAVEGIKSVHDAIKAGADIDRIAVSETFFSSHGFEYPNGAHILKMSDRLFEKLCDTEAPQGILAVIKMKDTPPFEPDTSKDYIYCDNIKDPGNLGTIIRTADAAGLDTVLLSRGCVDPYNPKTVRSSMGSFFSENIIRNAEYAVFEKFAGLGFSVIGGALSENTVDYREADYKKPCVIVVGNEADGISHEVLKYCSPVKIPILGSAESLNVSVAAGILLYEIVRNRS
ncbi:MAG TPA: RNA methyltransferase [Candidatus Ornithomonoglobus intestinigallinarum]|uniref:RNA methyltransferase n=1 Tax=Candidatus Ornithomonoglobus intestinigallinarum TaxID=2840894 RepID=A0A9D1H1E4_9FIRM|nr:RNA methyltransferase [Candidatus Ornithomonoglobus intestinigallinarum]